MNARQWTIGRAARSAPEATAEQVGTVGGATSPDPAPDPGRGAEPVPGASSRSGPGAPDPRAAVIGALDRLLTVGAFYPPDHVRCREAAQEVLQELRSSLGGSPALQIGPAQDGVVVQSAKISNTLPAARRVQDLLASLAVRWLEIDAAVSVDDLLDFAARMVRLRTQAKTSNRLSQFDLSGFPRSTRVHQREFGRRVRDSSGRALSGQGLEQGVGRILQALEGLETDDPQQAKWVGMIEDVLRKAVTRVNTSSVDLPAHSDFARSLDRVLSMGVEAIRNAATDLLSQMEDGTDELRDLFHSAEKALALSKDSESMEIMLDVLRKAAREAGEQPTNPPRPEEIESERYDCELSVADLCDALEEYAPSGTTFVMPDFGDRSELLGILLELLLREGAESLSPRIREGISAILSRGVQPAERRALIAILRGLLVDVDPLTIDLYLPLILHGVGQSGAGAAAEFLVELSDNAGSGVRDAIWPDLVNEALLGSSPLGSETTRRLHQIIARVPRELIRNEAHRLYRVTAISAGRVSKELMRPPVPELCAVFEQLLFSPQAEIFGSVLLRGLQAYPPDWAGTEALLFIPTYTTFHRAFLAETLQTISTGVPSPEIREMARNLIVQGLLSLEPQRRRESWVPGAIEALGDLRPDGAELILELVLKSRRFRIIPAWPGRCREAASHARRKLGSAAGTSAASAARKSA